MTPDYNDPTDPSAIALRYANPDHAPDWCPPDRPPWPGITPSATFRRWCADRLVELDALVIEEMRAAMTDALEPEHLERLAASLASPPMIALAAKADAVSHDLTASGPRPTLREIMQGAKSPYPGIHQLTNKLKRMAEPKRRGRTTGSESEAKDAANAAARDIWKLRKVVLPRFWPDQANTDMKLAKGELGKLVAPLHGTTANKAERAYVDGRFASK